ncbi:uncharacterized protein [Diadema setosum]|uniref:uncharacterized protein n=1 Tax=Diadema setosum TaxID=31175 RepID=UPI003B3B5721
MEVSQAAIDDILRVMQEILPSDHTLPGNYRALRNIASDFIGPMETFHICEDECVAFVGSRANMDVCPQCGKRRYEMDGKTARKRFYYLPLIPRLQRWFNVKTISSLLRTHNLKGEIFESLYQRGGPLGGDRRHLALALCVDGFDPFNHLHIAYSMTPVLNLNAYLEPLISELARLEQGVPTFDACTQQTFNLKACVALGCFDNQGLCKFTYSAGPGSVHGACHHCRIDGTYSKRYHKTLYLGSRRFLPQLSPLRKDERRERPAAQDREERVALGREVEALPPSKRQKRSQEVGKKGVELISTLETYRYLEYPVEAMHTIQVVAKKIFRVITGKDITVATELGEREFGRSFNAQDVSLSKAQLRCADDRVSRINIPPNINWKPKHNLFVSTPYLTCHDMKQLITLGILKYGLKGCLGKKQEETLFMFFDVITELCSYHTPSAEDMNRVELRTHEALARLERDFPLTIQTLCTHLIHHLPDTIRKCGPLVNSWMFSFERFMSFLKKRILNRRHPEATAVEAYRIQEMTTFQSLCEAKNTDDLQSPPKEPIRDLHDIDGKYMLHDNQLAKVLMAEGETARIEIHSSVTGSTFRTAKSVTRPTVTSVDLTKLKHIVYAKDGNIISILHVCPANDQ